MARYRLTKGCPVFFIYLIVFLFTIAAPAGAGAFTWRATHPHDLGLDSTKLALMVENLAARGTKGLFIVRHDRVACEWYAEDHGPEKRHYTASLAKALVGGMSLVLALNDGRLEVDDPAVKYIPFWEKDPLRKKITIRHLATHSSGIENAETPGKGHFEQEGWKLRFWSKEPDPFSMSVRQAPVIFEPGARYHYSNPGMGALSYAVTASYKGTRFEDIRTLLKARVMDPIGVPESEYSMGYGKTYEVDGLKLVPNWGGGSYTARAVARVGRLMLRKGDWDGQRLIDSTWVKEVTSYAGLPVNDRSVDSSNPASALCWYPNFDGVWPAVPRDAFAGAGAGNQVLLVVPSLDMIVVRNGSLLSDSTEGRLFWGGTEKHLFTPLMQAMYKPHCPPSPVIERIVFADTSTMVRPAGNSDNWPITWADDGHQYTAYGDGWGFEPMVEKKLSNGFARIIGPGSDFRGENIRSESGETTGGGRNGEKASGMLCIEGTLYMWFRNSGNSQLLWSTDYAKTWKRGFKFTSGESFGCPAFLNCGQNYSQARDNYVYVYSQDGPSAYEKYDRVLLARVSKDKIREKKAYEFFSGTDAQGNPVWSKKIGSRGAVLESPGRCMRLDVVYNPGLKRYLMALAFDHDGAWGIFDAPEPWGPWTTAFHTDYWGLGETHGYRIPSKWISDDGKSFFLVFSGRTHNNVLYDCFCVLKGRIETYR
ncbi:MAG: serine hydrolase [Gemmatimonadota bacterium]|nr:serine hydrolase [Gemmatimonadota bacterium]